MWNQTRNVTLILGALVGGTLVCQIPERLAVAVGQEDPRIATLRDRLQNGLRTRIDEEKAWVNLIVSRVESGDIPLKLVDSSFLWVRKNRGDYPYPFFYFERVLRLRGKQEGVQIPPYVRPDF